VIKALKAIEALKALKALKALNLPSAVAFSAFSAFSAFTFSALQAQTPDPRPNECWGFVFGAWSPPLDWASAGHAAAGSLRAPPAPELSSTGGAPRHDAASFERRGEPALVLYPTWWPVGVGITLDRQPLAGDTVRGVAHAFVADGRVTAPASRILAWRKPCNEPPVRPATRVVPDERRSLPEARAAAKPPRHRVARPR
jgi:hypothetical protein